MSFLFTVGVLIVVLGVLIFVHELGHFVAAKLSGIRVHRFALGMGNPVPGLSFRRGDTEYAICWLPLGGYVKMASREEAATSGPLEGASVDGADGLPAGARPVAPEEYFEAQPIWKRVIVILAGVTMNVLFAWLLFTTLAFKNGEQLDPTTTIGLIATDSLPPGAESLSTLAPGDRIVRVGGDTVASWNDVQTELSSSSRDTVEIDLADGRKLLLPIHPAALSDRLRAALALSPWRAPVIGQVLPGKPAARAGLAVGDTVLAVNGAGVTQWYDLVERIRSAAGQELTLTVSGPGGRRDLRMTPDAEEEAIPGREKVTVGKVGAGPLINVTSRPLGVGQALKGGAIATLAASTQIVRTVQGLFSARISSREVGGPILIGQLAAESARQGLDTFLAFMALVSVNLAVLNLLPVPVLDGGQFLFLVAEGVLRRPLSLKLRERLTVVGLFLIVCMMVLAFSNDFRRLLHF